MSEKGKAFIHSNRSGRNKGDFYPTHHSMVWQLIPEINIKPDWHILEPAAGENDIIEALQEAGCNNMTTAKDLFFTGDDFLVETEKYDCVMTNPPFSLASEFLERAFLITRFMIIFLLPLDYLHGKDRYDRFYNRDTGWRLSEVHIFIRRPMFTDKVQADGTYGTGAVTFAWFIWMPSCDVLGLDPVIKFINNDKYVKTIKSKTVDPKQIDLFQGEDS